MNSSTRLRIFRLTIIDAIIIMLALYLALLLRFEARIPGQYMEALYYLAPVMP
jgi:hypothetical protein